MGFQEAVRTCFRKYATFSGRASRPEFWYFALFLFLGNIVFGILDMILFGGQVTTTPDSAQVESNGPLASIFGLATLIPYLAAGWRRMHDTGRSGLFLLYPMIVMLGLLGFIGFMAGFEAIFTGNLGAIMSGLGGVVVAIAAVVLFVSPLLVLWWLTRPTQPVENEWGPPPA